MNRFELRTRRAGLIIGTTVGQRLQQPGSDPTGGVRA